MAPTIGSMHRPADSRWVRRSNEVAFDRVAPRAANGDARRASIDPEHRDRKVIHKFAVGLVDCPDELRCLSINLGRVAEGFPDRILGFPDRKAIRSVGFVDILTTNRF
jgi:hypothetical protein